MKTKCFYLETGSKERKSSLSVSIHYCFVGGAILPNEVRKRKKRYTGWKGASKTVFAEGMIVYVYNPKEFTEIATKYNKHTKCKVNIQKHNCVSIHQEQTTGRNFLK